ncbi:hypothetical protein Pmani_002870 [Petrolisthes manimaculis]|uniref:Uncharacterized protein n=1 Tax=Petrolisthes manimaculis TaxID=1843537 RepID=A0AAE1QHP1_9EUCA|nr:hypothetical protein Pmani_002870 [Petrolisthes manimaculis]
MQVETPTSPASNTKGGEWARDMEGGREGEKERKGRIVDGIEDAAWGREGRKGEKVQGEGKKALQHTTTIKIHNYLPNPYLPPPLPPSLSPQLSTQPTFTIHITTTFYPTLTTTTTTILITTTFYPSYTYHPYHHNFLPNPHLTSLPPPQLPGRPTLTTTTIKSTRFIHC